MTDTTTLPRLNRSLVPDADRRLLELPEKAVQFGTGAFLRGFIDFFVDAANRQGTFDGRIVAVGSTGSGRDEILEAQDGLYTLVSQGVVNGAVAQDTRVVSSVSRALSANAEWDAVLAVARSPELALVFSNTTEVGIVLDESDAFEMSPPKSFPAKLARFLYERASAFEYDPARSVVVVPCELIEDNGAKLKAIVRAHAERWRLDARFLAWLDAVPFCDTLVDRIVPGAPKGAEAERLRETLGYDDGLLTTCEPYRLFAIRGDAALKARLGFADADPGIVVTDDITPYRELKVRLLNGTHTAFVPAALLAGCETVREAVEHPLVGRLVKRLMFDEIAPTVPAPGAEQFARDVLDRFSNPFIRHALVDITLQATMKTRVRLVPTIERYAAAHGAAPPALAFGIAAYLLLQRPEHDALRKTDDQAGPVRAAWAGLAPAGAIPDDRRDEIAAELVRCVLSDVALWSTDLTAVPSFGVSVTASLLGMLRDGVPAALEALLAAPARPE
ncbi:Mannitol dehydrogenase domain-containing protein [Gemmatirosa kalamazoonensis]|uniref:Mannitol dehydrogenase domain-containing protein n=1 Tax=Gemmatirosa kalamazoonensis TaxID=861299 RepID=W0RC68_9BACT|nr:tagaturonate reductase [Gemmatirosa kalamazoonensis]AHG87915.1 Mannitol dehydrogenase domain-containing protein [Gemmatirosa kalamazoonensis]